VRSFHLDCSPFSRRSSFFASFNHVVTANPFELSLLAAP
jgi:hypothetical protein